jgi:hypothetical protein
MMQNDEQDRDGSLLDRFFCGLAEYIFHSKLGVADGELVSYVSSLLVRFTKTDALLRIRQLDGRPASEVITLMAEAESRIGVAKREVHRHIGDFTLFWTGLYPESLRESATKRRADRFFSYCEQGKRAYEIASEIEPINEPAVPCELLFRLSQQFDLCAYGLREVRRQWESGERDASSDLVI